MFISDKSINKLIKKTGQEYEDFKLNTAISGFMIFVKKVRDDGFITKEELRQLLILLNPLAPHITSEMFEIIFGKSILDESWPEYDETKLIDSVVEIVVQVNSKLIAKMNVPTGITNEETLKLVKQDEKVAATLNGKQIVKEIVVPNRLVNLIVR